jgi:LPS export ABC transporter protein LptC
MWRLMRWIPPVAGLLFLAGLSLTALPGASGASLPSAPQSPPEVTLRQIHLIETRGGSRQWELRADRAEVHERGGYTVLSRVGHPVEVLLYSHQGQLTCTADRVMVNLTTKDVQLEGGVLARSDQGTELRTEGLRWIAASRRLVTDQPVTVSRGGLVTRGRGMEADTDLEQVRILQNITSQLRSPASAPSQGPTSAARPAARSRGRGLAP